MDDIQIPIYNSNGQMELLNTETPKNEEKKVTKPEPKVEEKKEEKPQEEKEKKVTQPTKKPAPKKKATTTTKKKASTTTPKTKSHLIKDQMHKSEVARNQAKAKQSNPARQNQNITKLKTDDTKKDISKFVDVEYKPVDFDKMLDDIIEDNKKLNAKGEHDQIKTSLSIDDLVPVIYSYLHNYPDSVCFSGANFRVKDVRTIVHVMDKIYQSIVAHKFHDKFFTHNGSLRIRRGSIYNGRLAMQPNPMLSFPYYYMTTNHKIEGKDSILGSVDPDNPDIFIDQDGNRMSLQEINDNFEQEAIDMWNVGFDKSKKKPKANRNSQLTKALKEKTKPAKKSTSTKKKTTTKKPTTPKIKKG